MNCPACGEEGFGEDQQNHPYLCETCEYIDDDIGDYKCKDCGIYMENMAIWYHSSSSGHETERI